MVNYGVKLATLYYYTTDPHVALIIEDVMDNFVDIEPLPDIVPNLTLLRYNVQLYIF